MSLSVHVCGGPWNFNWCFDVIVLSRIKERVFLCAGCCMPNAFCKPNQYISSKLSRGVNKRAQAACDLIHSA